MIVKFDGNEMKDSSDLPRIVGQTQVGKDVDVRIVRKGQETRQAVKLGRLEDGEKLAKASTAIGGSRAADREEGARASNSPA